MESERRTRQDREDRRSKEVSLMQEQRARFWLVDSTQEGGRLEVSDDGDI